MPTAKPPSASQNPSERAERSASLVSRNMPVSDQDFQTLLEQYIVAHKQREEAIRTHYDAIHKLQVAIGNAIGPSEPVHVRFRRARVMVEGLCEAGISLVYDDRDLQAALQAGARQRSKRRKPK